MAKKKTSRHQRTTFEIRLVGPKVKPESVPIHLVSDALAAIQDIAAGRDSFERAPVPREMGINLIDVKKGSAVYSIHSHQPEVALENLKLLGKRLLSPDDSNLDQLISSINPIEKLSRVARQVGCEVKVTAAGDKKNSILEIGEDAYKRISQNMFTRGDATIIAKIIRVGGATEPRCLLRLDNRRSLLYCDVEGRDLLQELGQHLYEQVAIKGTATWLHSNWYIHKFKITSFSRPKIRNVAKAIESLRDAGLKAWDNVDDPQHLLEELR